MTPTSPVHINDLRHGDTVLHNGELVTVSRSNLRRDAFMGRTLCGDSYRLGTKPVQRVNATQARTCPGS